MGATQQILSSYGAAFVGPLDNYAANLPIALSVTNRLLSSYTGYAFNARRSSDSTTMDVGFNGDGTVNTTALLAWVGSSSAYITKVYNQVTGGVGDASQSTAAQQPRIVNAGVLEDGFYLNTSQWLDIASAGASNYTDGTNVQVALRAKMGGANNRAFDFGPDQIASWLPYGGDIYCDAPFPSGRISVTGPVNLYSTYKVTSLERAGSTSTIRFDGSALTSGGVSGTMSGTSIFRIGATTLGSGGSIGYVRTFCLWKNCVNPSTRAAALP